MMAVLVALLTASSAFAAVWPLMEREVRSTPAATALSRACRRITIIKVQPQRGTVQQGCSSARKRPCVRRRYW